jgi:hypothetical protein
VGEILQAAGAQIVEHPDVASVGEQPLDQMAADESSAAGDDDGARRISQRTTPEARLFDVNP